MSLSKCLLLYVRPSIQTSKQPFWLGETGGPDETTTRAASYGPLLSTTPNLSCISQKHLILKLVSRGK